MTVLADVFSGNFSFKCPLKTQNMAFKFRDEGKAEYQSAIQTLGDDVIFNHTGESVHQANVEQTTKQPKFS